MLRPPTSCARFDVSCFFEHDLDDRKPKAVRGVRQSFMFVSLCRIKTLPLPSTLTEELSASSTNEWLLWFGVWLFVVVCRLASPQSRGGCCPLGRCVEVCVSPCVFGPSLSLHLSYIQTLHLTLSVEVSHQSGHVPSFFLESIRAPVLVIKLGCPGDHVRPWTTQTSVSPSA